MNYGQIIEYDTANGPGFRLSLFVSGCSNHCEGCFQPETWNPKFGKEFTIETEDRIIQSLKGKPHDGRITILGGDPFELYNQEQVSKLIDRICDEVPEKNIWMYTGYLYEELTDVNNLMHTEWTDNIINKIDVLVDGPFILAQKDLRLRLKGSLNQRVIDIQKTKESGYLTEWRV